LYLLEFLQIRRYYADSEFCRIIDNLQLSDASLALLQTDLSSSIIIGSSISGTMHFIRETEEPNAPLH